MNKFIHSRRPLIQASLSLVFAFLTVISVAFGDSHSVNEAIENLKTINTMDCQAAFYAEVDEGPLSTGSVNFYNFSDGDYNSVHWNFGDGTTSSVPTETISHSYASSGNFQVTLTVWNDNLGCYSSTTEQISVAITNDDPCLISSCVYPGDANDDGKADLTDLINIGIGFGKTGPARPDADPTTWSPQPGPDWFSSTVDGINYKHFDSDGDGEIDYEDVLPILNHYSPMNTGLQNTSVTGPKVYLDFDVDSVLVTEATESFVTLSAGIVIGSGGKPIEDLYGMSLYFKYDSTLTQNTGGVVVDYNENSFFGDDNEVIAHGQDLRAHQQADIGLTRLTGENTTGYGRIATVSFIVIIDIIDGRTERSVPFTVPITGITAMDRDGNIIDVSLEDQAAEVVFIKESSTTGIDESALARQVAVYPNPASDHMNIELTSNLKGESLHMYNSLGQLVRTADLGEMTNTIPTVDLSPGVYLLNIQTDRGLVNKRLIIE